MKDEEDRASAADRALSTDKKNVDNNKPQGVAISAEKRKLTFKEKREFESLQSEIASLEKEKADVNEKLSRGNLPFEELQSLSLRIGEINALMDEKELRWLELSEAGQ